MVKKSDKVTLLSFCKFHKNPFRFGCILKIKAVSPLKFDPQLDLCCTAVNTIVYTGSLIITCLPLNNKMLTPDLC